MFHQGSLQSGIALAIQEQKLVACFVRDGGATSKEWEEEWLASGWLSSLLAQKAILLRLEAGSTEAGFLAAFSDLSQIPTFVIIHNGQLQVQLKSDVSKNDFINSVRSVLGANPIPGSSVVPTSLPQASTPAPSDSQAKTAAEDDLYGTNEPLVPAAAAPTPPSTTKGKQRATPVPESKPTTSSASSSNKAQQEARDALRKKKREDAEELARVKARIEADKAARKAKAEIRRAEREKERSVAGSQTSSTSLQPTTTMTCSSSKGSQSKTVSLNIRLFDGRTIRSTFPREATLQDNVRSWVDSEFSKLAQSDDNINHKRLPPYYFRHILAPQPSRELSAGDESKSLGDIDLAPSATLILVPVKGYTEAYSGSDGSSVVGAATGLVGGAFGLLSSTVGFVGSTIGSVIGHGAAVAADVQQHQERRAHLGAGGRVMGQRPAADDGQPRYDPVLDAAGQQQGMRVRTLADQRARESPSFYNGNQLSTEPRPEDNDKRD